MRALLVGIALTIMVMAFGAWNDVVSHREFEEIASIDLRLDRLSGTIVHFDEVLTMSARMAALTGEPVWENRYLDFENQLDAAIKETIALAPNEQIRRAAIQTDEANTALVAMEHRAFDLVRAGQREDANQILHSTAYEEEKIRYSQAIDENRDVIHQRVSARIRHHAQRANINRGFALAAFIALALGWSALLQLVRSSVAERGKAFDRLEGAVRARDEFLSIASHELRTPLTALALQVHSLNAARQRASLSEDTPGLDQKLETVERQVKRLRALVDALLDISRLGSGHLKLTLEDGMDLSALVRETVGRFEDERARASCEIRVCGVDQPIRGRWDRLRIEQVLSNLLANALKYGAGKPIEVKVEATGEAVRLSVRDHGIGIAPDQQAIIFDRFERVVPDRQYSGFGLGLWIVNKIVTAMHGEISVASQPGKGTTFLVVLPRWALANAHS